jgi:hypothetical protein
MGFDYVMVQERFCTDDGRSSKRWPACMALS